MLRNPIGMEILNAFGKHKTIYIDTYGLPETITLGICFKYNNYDDEALYFRIRAESESPYWSFASPKALGSLASGGSAYALWDSMGQRPNPNADVEETIKLILEAYRDENYTDLKWTYTRLVTVRLIYSPNWNLIDEDTFDEGDVEGWAGAPVGAADNRFFFKGPYLRTDYVLSPPYSIYYYALWTGYIGTSYTGDAWAYKSISVPDCIEAFATINIRFCPNTDDYRLYNVRFLFAGIVKAYYTGSIPRNRWLRFTIPLDPNTSGEFQVRVRLWEYASDPVLYIDNVRFYYR